MNEYIKYYVLISQGLIERVKANPSELISLRINNFDN